MDFVLLTYPEQWGFEHFATINDHMFHQGIQNTVIILIIIDKNALWIQNGSIAAKIKETSCQFTPSVMLVVSIYFFGSGLSDVAELFIALISPQC